MSGFFGLGGYGRPGKGVLKDEPKKRGLFMFFELLGRKFWRYVTLNLTYTLACIPAIFILFVLTSFITGNFISSENISGGIAALMGQESFNINDVDTARLVVAIDIILKSFITVLFTVLVGMGPATAGFTYVLRNFVREEHAWVWSDFWEFTFKNFKQSVVVFIIDIVALLLVYFLYMFYGSMPAPLSYIKYALFAVSLAFIMMHFYIYPMMVTFRLKLKDIYKNALIFTFAKLPLNLFVLALVLFIHVGVTYAVIMFGGAFVLVYLILLAVLEILIGISFTGLIINFCVYPVIKKYMLDADIETKESNERKEDK